MHWKNILFYTCAVIYGLVGLGIAVLFTFISMFADAPGDELGTIPYTLFGLGMIVACITAVRYKRRSTSLAVRILFYSFAFLVSCFFIVALSLRQF